MVTLIIDKNKRKGIPLKSATLASGNGGSFVKFYRFWLSSIFIIITTIIIVVIITIIIIITWWRKVAGIGDLLDCLLPDQRTLGIDDHDDDLSLF